MPQIPTTLRPSRQAPIPKAAASQLVAALFMAGAGLLLAGCDKPAGDATVGQRLDAAVDKTREVASDVRVEARTALGDAEARFKQDGPRVEERAKALATSAGERIDDAGITAQISSQLARDPELSALKIDVDTRDGAVVLRGPAPTASARERATTLAREVRGVKAVDNQLIVKAG